VNLQSIFLVHNIVVKLRAEHATVRPLQLALLCRALQAQPVQLVAGAEAAVCGLQQDLRPAAAVSGAAGADAGARLLLRHRVAVRQESALLLPQGLLAASVPPTVPQIDRRAAPLRQTEAQGSIFLPVVEIV